MKRLICLLSSILCLFGIVDAQQTLQPYILNGAATQRTCNCYVLTPDAQNLSGTVWNKNKVDLTQSFNYVFDVNLGCKDGTGADGIGFILQTKGTNLGATGQGLGFKGISPSLGVLIDTYQNANENDPGYDHLAIQMNGLSDHASSGNLAGPVMLVDGQENIEDCNWHLFRIKWDAVTHELEVSVDNQVRLTIQKDLVTDIFGGDPLVFWGFAGSTGGSSNVQQFCAALRPEFRFDSQQILCDGAAVDLNDNSSSFGSITRRWWDLGDGTISTALQPPAHVYPKAGHYEVKLVIEDNSGCISDTLKAPVTIGSYPVVDFEPPILCLGTPLQVKDATTVAVGTLEKWHWDWGGGVTSTVKDPIAPYTAPGYYNVQLTVTSKEGCTSTGGTQVQIAEQPVISATGRNACLGDLNVFTGTNETPHVPINKWYWDLGNGDNSTQENLSYRYAAGGKYPARLHAVSHEGCAAKPIETPVEVIDLQAHAGRDTLIARGQPLQMNGIAAGTGLTYTWEPALGLSDAHIPDPVAILQKDQNFRFIVTSPEGCEDIDTMNVKVYAGPEFYVPTGFSPNNDGMNDYFRVIAPGVPKLDFFRVWDRWGQEFFYTTSLSDQWDGTFKGKPAAVGTYVWMVQGVDYKGKLFSRQGTVTLVR